MTRGDQRRGRRGYLQTLAATAGGLSLSGCSSSDWPSGDESRPSSSDSDELHAGYETTEVTVSAEDGTTLGSVTAAVADTWQLRYLGLSDTESLPEDRGMLFIFDRVDDRTFVMREMDFGIDIVYADEEGTITRIHHAPAPGPDENGEQQRYPGRGQYVLEVVLDWTTDRGVEPGHTLDWGR